VVRVTDVVKYICKKSGWTENGKQWTHCRELFVELWRNLQDTADGDDDGQITVDEWVSTVTLILHRRRHQPSFHTLKVTTPLLITYTLQ